MRVYIDLDGVLTDGKLYIDHTGEKLFKAFHSRDVRAIRELIFNGFTVVIVSADDHPSGKHFADKVGADFMYVRDKSKLEPADYAIGDDCWDIPLLKKCNHIFCPCDADVAVRVLSHMTVLQTEGGKGCIAEMIRFILTENGRILSPENGRIKA